MEFSFFLQGLAIGLVIAAPVGPIGVLCMQRTLTQGRSRGFVSGLGAATADAFYGAIAAFGLTLISDFLVSQQLWIRLIGGVFLLYLGLRTLLAKPVEQKETAQRMSLVRAYFSTFVLTITNPTTILAFIAIFAGLGLGGGEKSYLAALILVSGVFIGSTMWWLALSLGLGKFRSKFDSVGLKWVNRVSGSVILGFGLFVFASLLEL